MATTNLTVGGTQASVPQSAAAIGYGRTDVFVESVIDYNKVAAASTDVLNIFNIPAGFAVMASGAEVLLADTAGNSGTVQMKVGSTAQGSAVAPSSLGFVATVGTFTPVVPSGSNAFMNAVGATGTINGIVRYYMWLRDCRMKLGTGVVVGTTTNPAGATVANVKSPSIDYTFETATVPVP